MSSTLTNLTHKQLFLTDCTIRNTEILITNPELLSQVRKVLRLQKSAKDGWPGDTIYIQQLTTNNAQLTVNRYEVEIKDWDDTTLTGVIKNNMTNQANAWKKWMIIGMPNKREKVELIVQKLTEIWLDEIIFRPSERSVIKTWNGNKSERLQKIAREAVEQSRGRVMPTVTFTSNIKEKLQKCELIVFDKVDNGKCKTDNVVSRSPLDVNQTFGLVGPEWGLTERDYEILKWMNFEVRELGNTMMRTETAAIVGGWIVKNSKC